MSQRPDYTRIRRFLSQGGVLQRELIEIRGLSPSRKQPPTKPPTSPSSTYLVWHAAARDGRTFATETCEWLQLIESYVHDGQDFALIEGPPGLFRRIPIGDLSKAEIASYLDPDREGPKGPARTHARDVKA
jgi:hypothetical protein